MGLTHIEHYLVITSDLEATRRFYCDALGFQVGPRPAFNFKGLWLYLGETACVHVAERASYEAHREGSDKGVPQHTPLTGSLDHVAFAGEDYDGTLARLQQHGISVVQTDVPGGRLRQLFVIDPQGVQIEMNFRA